ncbi:MAG: FAD-binding oxidoreductase [Paracoccus sp. (in: a-proteobacteria)]|nr:FAD-binding oxidoreductase [Paracoccus sp. (in: a-proteobacteria)]
MNAVLTDLAATAPEGVSRDPARREAARADWSGAPAEAPLAVVRPRTTAEAALILAACDRHRQPVVPQGGLTGLAGAANTRASDIALATDALTGIESLDREAGTITLRAGTPLAIAQAAADAEGWLLPIDLGARDSARIGGCIATNAGGLRVLRHGLTRANLLGVELVLPSGAVVGDLRGLGKDNTGYHLPSLVCGAEGTLGLVTRAVIRLHPCPAGRLTALCGLPDFAAVLALMGRARAELPGLSAFEVMWGAHYAFNSEAEGLRLLSAPPPFAVILEAETDTSPREAEAFEALLAHAFEDGIIADAMLPQSERELRQIWTIREGLAMDRLLPGLVNLDISAPPARLGDLAEAARAALIAAMPGVVVLIYGHLGDGNLHITAARPEAGADFVHHVDAVVYPLVAAAGGSISAEHGIGLLKRDWLHLMRRPEELTLMRAIKSAFDPNGIMNPGKLIP